MFYDCPMNKLKNIFKKDHIVKRILMSIFGVLICGTGVGISLAANKVPGIRATPVQTVQFAQLAREHNNANVIGLSGRFVSLETNEQIVDTFLTTEFAGGRHAARVEKIMREDDPAFTGVPEEFGL